MSSQSDQYRIRAEDCVIRAAQTNDREVRRQYEELAEQWRHLAEDAERDAR